MIASVGLKRHSSLLCRRINSIHQGRGYQHVLLCPTTAEICTNECCAYTCVLNHQMPFPARTSISDFQPLLCKLPKTSLLWNESCPSGDSLLKGCSQPLGSAGGNNHRAGPNHAAAYPAPLQENLGNHKHWHPTWSATPSQPLPAQKQGGSPFSQEWDGSPSADPWGQQ